MQQGLWLLTLTGWLRSSLITAFIDFLRGVGLEELKAFQAEPLGCSLGFWSIGFPQRPLWPCSAKLVAEKPGKGALRVPGYSQNGVPPPQPGIPGPKNTSTTMSSLGVPYYASVVYSSVIPGVFKTEFHLGLILPVPHPLGLSYLSRL